MPAPTGTEDTPMPAQTTGATGRGTLRPSQRLSLRPTPIPRHGTPTGTAGGGADGATDTGPTAMELTATAGGGNRLASSYSPKLHLYHANSFPLRAIFF